MLALKYVHIYLHINAHMPVHMYHGMDLIGSWELVYLLFENSWKTANIRHKDVHILIPNLWENLLS